MKFMMFIKTTPEHLGLPPQPLMDEIARNAEREVKAGRLILTGGLGPPASSTQVRLAKGKVTTTDGPFTEAKEVVGGFAVFDFSSKEEAVESAREFMELHRKHWPGWEGVTEVRQIFCQDDYPPQEK